MGVLGNVFGPLGQALDTAWVNTRDRIFNNNDDDDDDDDLNHSSSSTSTTTKKKMNTNFNTWLHKSPTHLSDAIAVKKTEVAMPKLTIAAAIATKKAQSIDSQKRTIWGDMWQSFKDGVFGGVKNAAEAGVDWVTDKLIPTKGVQDAQEGMSEYGSQVITKSISKFFKRNWFYFILPFPVLFLAYKIATSKNKKRRRR